MNKKTEELRKRIGIWLPDDRKAKVITAILCECKEAGLKFVPDFFAIYADKEISPEEIDDINDQLLGQMGEIEI